MSNNANDCIMTNLKEMFTIFLLDLSLCTGYRLMSMLNLMHIFACSISTVKHVGGSITLKATPFGYIIE